jgi:hypothetical protein
LHRKEEGKGDWGDDRSAECKHTFGLIIGGSAIEGDRIDTSPSDNWTRLETVIEKYDPSGAGACDAVGMGGKNMALKRNSMVALFAQPASMTASALIDLSLSSEYAWNAFVAPSMPV